MAKAKRGDRVKLHFTGRLADGRVFESTLDAGDGEWQNFRGRAVAFAPMELVIGAGEMLPAFEESLVGLEPGQEVTFTIPSARAFGPRREECVTVVSRADLTPAQQHLQTFRVAEGRRHPNGFDPKVGDVLQVTAPDGAMVPARVRALGEDTITLDANHPLAGQDLVFEVRLEGIV
jgi:peptidylprolyl isomerase